MIKTFKIFENSYSKYQEGDYVLLSEDDIHKKWRVKLEVYIYEVRYNEDDREYQYHVEGEYLRDNEEAVFWINSNEIERRMTTEEIENYKIKKETQKYNL
jgi:hypothetical protein